MYDNEENVSFYNFYEQERPASPAPPAPPPPLHPPRKKKRSFTLLLVGGALCFTILGAAAGGFLGVVLNARNADRPTPGPAAPPTAAVNPDLVLETHMPPSEGASAAISQSSDFALNATQIYEKCNAGVVAISTELTTRNAFGQPTRHASAGSGFIVTESGYVITNHHVVEGATKISVILFDGTIVEAALVGSDRQSDVAVLKIEFEGLTALELGDSSQVRVGDSVYAIGNALGELTNTLTDGIVSALDRELNIEGTPQNVLQTNAAINRGNSGGPLLNAYGQVIGIVNAKSISTGVEGLGFAIPLQDVQGVVNDLLQNGYVRSRASLNISAADFYRVMGNRQTPIPGAGVYSVDPGGAADLAGVRENDLITAIDGSKVESRDALILLLRKYNVGDKVVLTIDRDGREIKLEVTLGEPTQQDTQSRQDPQQDYSEDPFRYYAR